MNDVLRLSFDYSGKSDSFFCFAPYFLLYWTSCFQTITWPRPATKHFLKILTLRFLRSHNDFKNTSTTKMSLGRKMKVLLELKEGQTMCKVQRKKKNLNTNYLFNVLLIYYFGKNYRWHVYLPTKSSFFSAFYNPVT